MTGDQVINIALVVLVLVVIGSLVGILCALVGIFRRVKGD